MMRPSTLRARLTRFARAEDGTFIVELAVLIPVFLLLIIGLVEFGRMGAEYVMADKATQMATRIAVVRPPACASVPTFNARGTTPSGTIPPHFGTKCTAGSTVCASPATVTCTGSMNNATAAEIWGKIAPLMPTQATVANLSFSYAYDNKMNFLGGPYVPTVTVEIQNLNFQFVTPLGGLAVLAGGSSAGLGATAPFPSMSMTLPGEDLDLGNNG